MHKSRVLAERVAQEASALGIQSALIGAAALAVHNFVRATDDVDLATFADVFTQLRDLADSLRGAGLKVDVRLPDETDPLGGVLRVWEREDDEGEPLDAVDVVNFKNPFRASSALAAEAIREATSLDLASPLRYVSLPYLIAMKLYGGSRRDLADVVDLLVRNPDAELEEIRVLVRRYGGLETLELLIREATAVR